ncbi:MAG: DUF6544 family protein [Pseudomonadota bacterium]
MRVLIGSGIGIGVLAAGIAGAVGVGSVMTERDIGAFRERIEEIAETSCVPSASPESMGALPEPVQRYFGFVFPDEVPEASIVRLSAEGQFRRPLTDGFSHTTSEQVIAIGAPALMFSATTPVAVGIWARAYDFFAEGEMEMKAKVLSLITVVDETGSPELNTISLRRWLLESALFPQALLPGCAVTWDAVSDTSARATVSADGLQATMIAHFAEDGRMTHMTAEEDGDLTTPYHGSGEHVTREDYRDVGGTMIPHRFVISRAADGEIFPFFDAELTAIAFE